MEVPNIESQTLGVEKVERCVDCVWFTSRTKSYSATHSAQCPSLPRPAVGLQQLFCLLPDSRPKEQPSQHILLFPALDSQDGSRRQTKAVRRGGERGDQAMAYLENRLGDARGSGM